MHVLGQKNAALGDQFLGQGRARFHERRIEALQHVWVCFQSEPYEFLDLPVSLLLVILQLLRNSSQRPFQIGRRQVEPPAINIRSFLTQPVRSGADNTSIDYESVEIGRLRSSRHLSLNVFEDCKFGAAKRLFCPLREPNTVAVLRRRRAVRNDANASARPCQDLRPCRNYQMKPIHVLYRSFSKRSRQCRPRPDLMPDVLAAAMHVCGEPWYDSG